MATIHDRMPVILEPKDYRRWLSDEPDPRDLMKPFPAELMKMWPIDRKVGSANNDTPDVLDEIDPNQAKPAEPTKPKKPDQLTLF